MKILPCSDAVCQWYDYGCVSVDLKDHIAQFLTPWYLLNYYYALLSFYYTVQSSFCLAWYSDFFSLHKFRMLHNAYLNSNYVTCHCLTLFERSIVGKLRLVGVRSSWKEKTGKLDCNKTSIYHTFSAVQLRLILHGDSRPCKLMQGELGSLGSARIYAN